MGKNNQPALSGQGVNVILDAAVANDLLTALALALGIGTGKKGKKGGGGKGGGKSPVLAGKTPGPKPKA